MPAGERGKVFRPRGGYGIVYTVQDFSRRVIEVIRNIPPGRVLSYGEVAELAGNKMGARQVTRLLHTLTDSYNLPWHRVVGKGGVILVKGEQADLQRALLEDEGVEFDEKGRVDVDRFSAFEGLAGV